MPALPSVVPVMMNAAKVGPRKTQAALTKNTASFQNTKWQESNAIHGEREWYRNESCAGVGHEEVEDQRMPSEQAPTGRSRPFGGVSGDHVEAPSLATPDGALVYAATADFGLTQGPLRMGAWTLILLR